MKSDQKQEPNSTELVNHIIEGIQDKKGKNIVTLNMKKLDNAVCDYFVICHGSSKVQVEAIADYVEETVRERANSKPFHIEGRENAEWILLDYFDVVVHVFVENMRSFYQLEDVWADAEKHELEDNY
ncbi:MAG: ribosome silencing factor [Bacteroidales bacterium]|nr:ribosome silencing factor [Bacteroidales bacterium]MCF8327366.1 ribosome silencing factor [Bacteroidales bacterium]